EIFSGGSLDGRTDLYSLGVILYQVTTSQLPFPSKDPVRVVAGHLGEEPTPPRDLNPTIPYELDDLILDLLDKLPEGRPRNALEVKERISKLSQRNLGTKEDGLYSSYIYSGELIGREKELARLEQSARESIHAQGKVVLLQGEAGIGKSTLLRRLKMSVQFEGIPFLMAGCSHKDLAPYQPIRQILYEFFPYLKNKHDFLLQKYSHPLSLLVPELLSPVKESVDLGKKGREDFCREIVDFLIEASLVVPLTICIDDLDMCGEESFVVLENLANSIHRSKIFLCCSFPIGCKRKDIGHLLKKIKCSCGEGAHLELNPFSAKDIKEFISSRLLRAPSGEVTSLLHDHTKGSPFALTEWLKFLLENKVIQLRPDNAKYDLESLKEIKPPCSEKDIILKNLDRHGREALELLHLCILSGGGANMEQLSLLAGRSKEELEYPLFILSEDHLMRRAVKSGERGFCYRLVHPFIERFLPDVFSHQDRKALHQRIALYLDKSSSRESYPPIENMAYHYFQGGDHQKGFEYCIKTADKMQRLYAFEKTLYWLENAQRLAKKFTGRKERLKREQLLAMKRGDSYRDMKENDKSLENYRKALKLSQSLQDKERIAEVYSKISVIYESQNNIPKALFCLRKGLKIYQSLNNKLKMAEIYESVAYLVCIKEFQYGKSLEYYRKSLRLYRLLSDHKGEARCLNKLGVTYTYQGEFSKSKECLKQFLEIAEKIGDKEMCSQGLNNLAIICFCTDKYSEGIEYLLAALRINEEIDRKEGILFNLANLGDKFCRVGKFKQAISYSLRCLDLARQVNSPKFRKGTALLSLGLSNFELGNYDQAIRYLEESLESAEQADDKHLRLKISMELAGFYLNMNQLEKTEELLASAEEILKDVQDKHDLIFFYEKMGWLNLKKEKSEQAEEYLNKAKQLVQQVGIRDENILVNLLLCDAYFESGELKKVSQTLSQTQSLLGKSENKRYEPQYYLNLAKKEWWDGRLDQALRYLEISLTKAEKQETPETIWRIHHQLGKLSLSMNNLERAYKEFRAAQNIIKELSTKVGNENMKKRYFEDKEKIELLSDIRSVVELMMGEKVVHSLG
ncbi:MAG TPA: tetratricopeptide repeat protein, partial [candidate division Zixibacteria bacterium]